MTISDLAGGWLEVSIGIQRRSLVAVTLYAFSICLALSRRSLSIHSDYKWFFIPALMNVNEVERQW
jgi:hypothetical protein